MGGRSSLIPDTLVAEWSRQARVRRDVGESWRSICTDLAAGQYHWETVYRHIRPEIRVRSRQQSRDSHRRHAGEYKAKRLEERRLKEERRAQLRDQERLRRETHGESIRAYNVAYLRLTRNPVKYLLIPAFLNRSQTSLDEIVSIARRSTDQLFRPSTIRNILAKYAEESRSLAPHKYRLVELPNGEWYYGNSRGYQELVALSAGASIVLSLLVSAAA